MSQKETKDKSAKERREERLRAQLRANLQRRKGQARVRKASAAQDKDTQDG
jgi:hypothetical protein